VGRFLRHGVCLAKHVYVFGQSKLHLVCSPFQPRYATKQPRCAVGAIHCCTLVGLHNRLRGKVGWRRGVAVTSLGVLTKLLYVGPG